ncbi:MAG TPA: hypothetical protein VNM66_01000, partial [Thermodesulfobacteriota bacterium]|nr:hypothetical protein [Thermodesulfobacteriota bacterium]
MRTKALAILAAAAVTGLGLVGTVDARGGARGATGGADGDTSGSPATGGGVTGSTPAERGGPMGGPGASGTAGAAISSERLDAYIQARQQLESRDPALRRALREGDVTAQRERIQSGLSGTRMSADEFIRLHQQVQSDPTLRAQVEAQLGTGSPGGSGRGMPRSGAPDGAGSGTTGSPGGPAPSMP